MQGEEYRAQYLREALARLVTEPWENAYSKPEVFFNELITFAGAQRKQNKDAALSAIRKTIGKHSEGCVTAILVRPHPPSSSCPLRLAKSALLSVACAF